MALTSLVPCAHVADMDKSLAFYQRLGFLVRDSRVTADGHIMSATLECGDSGLMLAQTDQPVDRTSQGVLFHGYDTDVAKLREELVGQGVAAGKVEHPEHLPAGQIRVEDPDGYVLLIGQIL
ncbi:MAG TPA: VOC family protein [Pilimelia sp.]|nr:VOC family protein [Pilimelia sp.]